MDSHRFIPMHEQATGRRRRWLAKCASCGQHETAAVHAMTYEQLFQRLADMDPLERQQPMRWWGDERGGIVVCLNLLAEPYVDMSEGEGLEPLSVYKGTEDEREALCRIALPAGTLMLEVD